MMIALKRHYLSSIYPDMPDDEFEALSKSIENLGLISPIVLFEGEVLDGWHRYQACLDTLTAIKTIEYLGDNPCAFVEAQNDNRRHLTKSQQALIAVRKAEWLPSHRPTSSTGAGIKGATVAPLTKSNNEIAVESGVSKRLIQQAKAVETKGSDVVKKSVINGNMTLDKAYALVTENKKEMVVIADEPEYSEIDKLRDDNSELKDLIEDLHNQISIGNYDGAEPIEDILKELRITKANLKQVTISRDSLMNELNAAKRQIIAQRKEIDKLKK